MINIINILSPDKIKERCASTDQKVEDFNNNQKQVVPGREFHTLEEILNELSLHIYMVKNFL